jgi:multidrug efflux pump subunit AcrA (membrane-fusion protein)
MEDSWRSRLIARVTRSVAGILVLAVAVAVSVVLTWTAPVTRTIGPDVEPPTVVVLPARLVDVQRQWGGFGTAAGMVRADVPVRVTAVVAARPADVRPGAAVRAGQLLVALDGSDFTHQVEIAARNLDEITAQLQQLDFERYRLSEQAVLELENVQTWADELERVQRLLAQGAGNPREVETTRRSLNAARRTLLDVTEALDSLEPRRAQLSARRQAQEAALRLAELNVERCAIVSPIDGIIQAVDVEVGESVTTGQRAARVVSLAAIEVPVRLPAAARPSVRVGDTALLRAARGSGPTWSAPVVRIAPEDDAQSRTVTVYVELRQAAMLAEQGPHAPGLMTPGLFLEATVTTASVTPRWVVPRRSLRAGRLLVVEEDRLLSRPASIDFALTGRFDAWPLLDEQWAVLEEPLADGMLIVLDGSTALRAGQVVRPVRVDEATAADGHMPDAGVAAVGADRLPRSPSAVEAQEARP